MDDKQQQHSHRRRRSLSRSPSQSRRSSLRGSSTGEKSSVPSTSTGITKSKSKRGLTVLASGAVPGAVGGSKKERWLLTRKTWRYMTDAVGNLLPEYYYGSGAGTGAGVKPIGNLRRGSSSAGSGSSGPLTSTIGASYYYSGTPTTTPTSGYTSYSLASPPFRQSVPRSSICSSSGTVPLVEEEVEPAILQATLPEKIDVPAIEKHFQQACNKENKFLLWTRNKAKGLSGPALRDAKLKEKEKQSLQQQQGQSKSGKGGSFFRRRGEEAGGEYDEAATASGASGPTYLTRSQSSSSSLMTMGGSSSAGGMRSGRRATQDLLDYFSPGEEDSTGGGAEYDDELLHLDDDADDYDEYDYDRDDQPTVRRKSSTTSSIVSMVSGGLAFFRHHQPGKGKGQQQQQGGQPPQYSGTLGTIFIRTIPSTGVQKYYRNCAVQTEPFPEEILVRLRLQFIHEEQQQGKLVLQQTPAQLQAQAQQQNLRYVMSLPIDKSAPSATGFPQLQGRGSGAPGSTIATGIMTGSLSAVPSLAGTPTDPAVSAAPESASGSSAPTPAPDQTDKKSEESGYSSASISDTVMRYLRMARKSSKADNKETIDKFKTVNYDRSLRYIKSKNVTVEEALEHEKNKALQAAQLKLGIVPTDDKAKGSTAVPVPPQTTASTAGSIPKAQSTKPAETKVKKATAAKGKKTKVGKKTDKTDKKEKELESPQVETAPLPGTDLGSNVLAQEDFDKTKTVGTGADSNATSTPQTPLSPTSTSAPPSSMYSSRSGSGSSSVPPMSPPPVLLASTEMMLQGTMIFSSASGGPILQSATVSSAAAPLTGYASSPHLAGFPPPPTVVGIGIQAGESLVHLLKNYNPSRKFSDFSIPAGATPSEYSSLVESMCSTSASPRYSVISTGTVASGPSTVQSSISDSELFANAGAVGGHGQYILRARGESLLPATATSMSTGTHPASYVSARNYSSVGTSTYESPTESQARLHQVQLAGTTTNRPGATTLTSSLKKSASSQPVLLRIDDSSTHVRSPCPSPGNISSTSSTGSAGGILISHLGSSGSGHYGTSSFPSLATASSSSPTAASHLLRHQHHSALGLYTPRSSPAYTPAPTFLSSSMIGQPSYSSTSLGTDMLASSTRSGRKKQSTLTWATTASSSSSMSASLPVVSLASSASAGGSGGRLSPKEATTSVTSSKRTSAPSPSSPSNYSSLTSTASQFLSSFRSGLRKGSGESGKHGLFGSGDSGNTGGGASSYFGILGHSSSSASSDKKQKHLSPSPSSSQLGQIGRTDKGDNQMYSQLIDSSSHSHDPLVMQKSKSSSSVFQHGSHGSTSGGTGGEKRGSTASTSSIVLPATHASAGSRLMSKTRLFKSRSKSQSRVSSAGTCTWAPQGKCKWTSLNGRQVTLQPTTVLHLNETEQATLQKVALAKLQALNLDVDIKIPKEKPPGTLQKPKRRPYLLKKKALSTGFFESGAKDASKELGSGGGLVFGVSLSQCVANDKKLQEQQQQLEQANRASPRDWEQNIPASATSTTTIKRSQNGSRNSVSSVFEGTPGSGPGVVGREDKPQSTGSSESLCWAHKRGSNAALDSLSSSSGDLLAEQNIPSIDSSPIGSVPTIVTSCIKHLENYGLHTTGIFRVSTSLKRIRQLREEIDSGKVMEFGEEHSPHDIAALLKEFLRDLPEPLLSKDLYQAFLRTQKIRNRKLQLEAVQHLIQLLPVANRDTLVSLLKFFAKVVENAADKRSKTGELLTGNKMEAYSLATLIAPNILPCMPTEGISGSNMDPNSAATRERRESIDVVNYMISNYRELFEISPELLDEVYVHMMDTHPEAVENIFKQRTGQTDDLGLDELETSSVFEGSECGEPVDAEIISLSSVPKKGTKREDILHREGQPDPRMDKREKSRHHHHRAHHASRDSDLDKQQSGGESDSSSTKSATRWFRRSKHTSDHSTKARASSDSGSEQVLKGKKLAEQQHAVQRRKDSLHESKRANSLDSVSLKEPGSGPVNVITLTQEVFNPHIDQNLQVPDNSSRRQSSPVLDSAGIIKASLKIPVPVPISIDDTDIPFIEDDSTETIHQQLHHHHHILRAHQPQLVSIGRGRSASAESARLLRHGRFTSNTPGSSQATSPFSSPLRQPSSEASTPSVLSPPMSPTEDPLAFQYEEMTARFCIGAPGHSDAKSSSSGSTSSSLHSGTTIVSKVPNTKATTKPPEADLGSLKLTSTKSKTLQQSTPTSITPSASSTTVAQSESKALGKETKGANIAGLIKSKTADFEKIAKESKEPLPSAQPSKIASSMRLRSQGNIQLKQQFLLRQHEKHSVPPAGITAHTTNLQSQQPAQPRTQPLSSSEHTTTPSSYSLTPSTSSSRIDGPSRWKRSEIISSRQSGSTSLQPASKYNKL